MTSTQNTPSPGPGPVDPRRALLHPQRRKTFALVFVFFWFLLGGVAHFVATETEMRIVPPYIPWPRAAVLTSGFFELAGAMGLIWSATRRVAGLGLFALTIAVTPAHIYMLQRPELFDLPIWALWIRLPIQVALLWLIAWCTCALRPSRALGAGEAHRLA